MINTLILKQQLHQKFCHDIQLVNFGALVDIGDTIADCIRKQFAECAQSYEIHG